MKKLLALLFFSVYYITAAQSQKIIGDCTITYTVSSNDISAKRNLSNAVKTVYIKGKKVRVDLSHPNYRQSIIYDGNTGTATILKEIGTNKFMSTLDATQWKDQNKQFEELRITLAAGSKTILGYECKKALAQLKNGTAFVIYYVPELVPTIAENSFQFKDVPGLVLEYETEGEKSERKITYTATSVSFNPVPAIKFEIPEKGYKLLMK